MRHRQVIAVLALLGTMLSAYLTMHHYGLTGPLACGGSQSCDAVQASRWSVFMGVPVAAYGVGGYLTIFVVALAGLQGRWAESAGPTKLIAALSGVGVAFTAYLTWLELFKIHAVCRWCVASAVIILLIFVAALVSLPSLRTRPSALPQP
jgi:uncharacterized membrane protein